jgi:hypothetical protein
MYLCVCSRMRLCVCVCLSVTVGSECYRVRKLAASAAECALSTALNNCEPIQGGCVDCNAGQFSNATGADAGICQDCPSGKWTGTDRGQEECSCTAGRYGATGVDECQACPVGTYLGGDPLVLPLQNSELSDCIQCGPGQYTDDPGSQTCTQCREGASVCEAGTYYVAADDDCLQSGATADTNSSQACTHCPAGQFSENAGMVECESCEAGKVSNAGEVQCLTCPGSESPNSDQSGCVNEVCSQFLLRKPGNYCPTGNCSVSSECAQCPIGRVSMAGVVCTPCNETSGKISSSDQSICEACPATKQPNPTYDECEPCTGNEYSTYGIICEPCAADSRADESHALCVPCSVGLGGEACSECLPGFHLFGGTGNFTSANSSEAVCMPCPAGANCPGGRLGNVSFTGLAQSARLGPGF